MADRAWSPRERVAVVAVVVLALLQVGLPIRAMFDERPARYGWQMYSTVSQAPEVVIKYANGEAAGMDVLAPMADPRAEIRWAEHLIDRLCRDPEIESVVVRERGDEEHSTCR